MALSKATIKGEIKSAFTAVMEQEQNRDGAIDTVADKIATAVINAIKSATITYTTGLVAPTGGGPVTGAFGNIIS